MTALALGDEQPPLPGMHVRHAQAAHLAATQPAQQHRQHDGAVAMGAQPPSRASTSTGDNTLGSVRGVRISGTPRAPEISGAPRAQSARHRITSHLDIVTSEQVREKP